MPAPKTIAELTQALQSAPQEKEGAFRVATWRMVLDAFVDMQKEIQTLKQKLGFVEQTATTAASKTVDVEALKKVVKDDLSKADINKILF